MEKLWKDAIFETLIREGFVFNSSKLGEAQYHGKAYSQLSKFLENFESDSYSVFRYKNCIFSNIYF